MAQVIKRAAPFLITFILGVTIAYIFGMVPKRRIIFGEHTRSCKFTARTNVFTSVEATNANLIDLTEIQASGVTDHIFFTLSDSYSSKLNMKEQALFFRSLQQNGYGSDFVVSYAPPESIDGKPVTADATVWNIPRPRFWSLGTERKFDCNAIVRVDLDESGTVSRVEMVSGYADRCPYTRDILSAAGEIRFNPALRDGVPVSQRISIMYRRD